MTRRTLWLALLACSCAACVARHVRIQERGLTCTEAQRIAVAAVQRMGYTISETTKASPGAPGMIVAAHAVGTSTHMMMVSIFCTSQGTEVEAKSDEGGLGQLAFPAEFRRSFAAAAANQPPPRAAAASGLDVLVAPEHGDPSKLGVDFSSLGVLPVSLRITNRTSRTYRFSVDGVVLQTLDGERVDALPLTELLPRVSTDAAATLRQKAAADGDIKANETLTGLLFFPFKAYTRARVELTDLSSDESEGFSIEF